LLAFPASGRFGGALAGMWRYTVKFDIALALQLRSQNVLLIAEALSDIEDVTWKVIKVWLGFTYLWTPVSDILMILDCQRKVLLSS